MTHDAMAQVAAHGRDALTAHLAWSSVLGAYGL